MTLVLAVLDGVRRGTGRRRSKRPADPADATYHSRGRSGISSDSSSCSSTFPASWEVVGALVLPGVAVTLLALLPWIDRSPHRDPRRRTLAVADDRCRASRAVVSLTALGWRDRPVTAADESSGRPARLADDVLASNRGCPRCHSRLRDGRAARTAVGRRAVRSGSAGHVGDPEMIAPGLREPPTSITDREVAAIVAYVRRSSRAPYPGFPAADRNGIDASSRATASVATRSTATADRTDRI